VSAPSHNGNAGQPTRSTDSASLVERRRVPRDKLLLGSAALAAWILFFAAGLLIETVEYRLVLALRSVSKQLGSAELLTVPGTHAATVREDANQRQAAAPNPARPSATTPSSADSSSSAPSTPATADAQQPSFSVKLHAFVASMICFTPINLAILTLVAGLLGGCASNIAVETMPHRQQTELHDTHPRRYWYLQEPPVSAAIRGFIVYLCVIGGLYVAMDDPFKDPTPAQYIRLAGLMSILALVVGYDSSRLEDWLSIIPGPGQQRQRTNVPEPEPLPPRSQPAMEVLVARAAVSPIPATEQEAAAKEAAATERLDAGGG